MFSTWQSLNEAFKCEKGIKTVFSPPNTPKENQSWKRAFVLNGAPRLPSSVVGVAVIISNLQISGSCFSLPEFSHGSNSY